VKHTDTDCLTVWYSCIKRVWCIM